MTGTSPTFLRMDRPELTADNVMIVRAVPPADRQRRRTSSSAPLAYLFETVSPYEPDSDVELNAGHYDRTNLVWSFSGEVTAIVGLTEPLGPGDDRPRPTDGGP
ncbi:hypothetical protein [Pseudonocardia lacus]|uniref:hypothetical protein n=1 Tax=Pseudonocardia lacus TaxID=2835865 RepID=UPI001BDD45E6|nr:hypothetical protein [Pseudonocardia lacus]